MPAAQNQDFLTYVGDSATPIFTVVGADGSTPVDISGSTEITWIAQRNLSSTAALTKKKSTGGISFVNTGADGKFQVTLAPTDTATLSGWYMHVAAIFSGGGASVITCAVGRMNVGTSPNWTWDPGSVGIDPLYTVRQMIGDTLVAEQLQSDQQIRWALSEYSNEWLAAAECCRNISAQFSRQVDVVQGQLKTNYSQRAKTYMILANNLEQRGFTRSGATAYAGGTSISDKQNNALNPDRTPPQFLIGMFDNTLPESPLGHQEGAGQDLPAPADSGALTVQGGP